MYTYEMVALADQNNKTYECKYGTYNSADRFVFNEDGAEIVIDHGYRELFDILMHENLWKLQKEDVKKMSLQDIERELGYRVQIVAPEIDEDDYEDDYDDEEFEKRRKRIDDTIDFFERFFGAKNIDRKKYY